MALCIRDSQRVRRKSNEHLMLKIYLFLISICRILPKGSKDICYNLHVPTPGRVQYYRAEALPFIPAEIKTQIRFPKAFAMSRPNLRYLDAVKAET